MTDIEVLQGLRNAHINDTYKGTKLSVVLTTAIEALQEKQERDKVKQWLDDMENPLEPIKVEAALRSEILKINYRKEHNPKDISELDLTIIAVLAKELGIN